MSHAFGVVGGKVYPRDLVIWDYGAKKAAILE